MKRILAYFLVLNILLLSACSPKQQTVSETVDTTDTVTSTEAVSSNEIAESETENQSSEPASDKNDNNAEKSDNNDNSKVDNSKLQKKTQTTSVSEKGDKADSSFGSKETTTKSSVESSSQQPSVKYATKADEKAIAEKMLYYINQYRKEEGRVTAKKLSGLTTYTEYRSRQLVTNFAHDTIDQRSAATALKYGEYVDPSLYGMTGEPYYTSSTREAIVKLGPNAMNLTVDEVAKRMADSLRNSSGHWNYVGAVQKASSFYNSEYIYIACGVTYSGTTWYGCVSVSDIDTDELTRLGMESNAFREQTYG